VCILCNYLQLDNGGVSADIGGGDVNTHVATGVYVDYMHVFVLPDDSDNLVLMISVIQYFL
jgi:hypothetical protein